MNLRAAQRALSLPSLSLNIAQYLRAEASVEMQTAAKEFEQRFSIQFSTLTHFPKSTLASLHHVALSELEMPETVRVISREDPSVLAEVQILTETANALQTSIDDRSRYFDALKRIYRKLLRDPDCNREDPNMLFVGVEREGRLIAESMDCMPEGHSIRPHAKRIWFDDGLLVGFTDIPLLPTFGSCVVIDGAIASGSTLIALMTHLHPVVNSFRIFTAHATIQGLHALTHFADATGLDVRIVIGHATSGLNAHYYAIVEDNPGLVVVGDLGDTICEIDRK